jgi:hypothetical protein
MSPPHNPTGSAAVLPLRAALTRSVAEECGGPRVVVFNPNALAYEAFSLGRTNTDRTRLLEPLQATSLADALAEATSRWHWDRGDRLGIREIGGGNDRIMVYAVRRKCAGSSVYRNFQSVIEHARWLDHITTIDLNVVAGINRGALGSEVALHERRQRQRPDGAQMERRS